MVYILNLSKEQIETAIQLFEIKETDNISDEQAQKAYSLYMGLHNKPNLLKGPDTVKPINNIDRTIISLSSDLFKTPQRIIYLTRWVIKILPFIDLLSEVGKLPLNRTINDFQGYLNDIFHKYLSVVRDICNKIPENYNLIKNIDLQNVEEVCNKILSSLQEYYKGYPNTAFTELKDALDWNLSPEGYLFHIMALQDGNIQKLYKMRVGTNHTYTSDEMFHIPFELRGLVNTNRYSIPGLPCLYVGSSPLTCWEELNKPDLNITQTSLFLGTDLSYLNLSTPPGAVIDKLILTHNFYGYSDKKLEQTFRELLSYVVVWPLMAACSVRVKNTTDSFKPEYIIPQLLLQWIRQSSFDGVCYFSTKINNYSMKTAGFYRNFAFPAQEQKIEGHCSILRGKFDITDAVPWQMFQIYKDSYLATPNEESVQAELEFVDGMKLLYFATDFSKLETFLINKMTKQKDI